MNTNSLPGALLGLGAVLLVVLLVGGMVYYMVRQARKMRQALEERGWTALQAPDSGLLERMQRMEPGARLVNVFRLDKGGYQAYLFDLWGPGRNEDSARTYQMMALISPDFHLPRLTLFPNVQAPMFGQMMGFIMNTFASRKGLQQITIPEHPTFDSTYLLMGADEAAVRDYFTLERLNRLTADKNFQIDGLDDLLTFTRPDMRVKRNPNQDQVGMLLEGAAMLYAVFRD